MLLELIALTIDRIYISGAHDCFHDNAHPMAFPSGFLWNQGGGVKDLSASNLRVGAKFECKHLDGGKIWVQHATCNLFKKEKKKDPSSTQPSKKAKVQPFCDQGSDPGFWLAPTPGPDYLEKRFWGKSFHMHSKITWFTAALMIA